MLSMKRITALFLSALLMGSTVCTSAMAAEVNCEEQVALQEEGAKQEEVSDSEAETPQSSENLETEEQTDNAAENVTTEAAEQDVEPENAAENVTTEVAEPEEPGAAETTEEKQSEIANTDSQESSDVGNTEIIAGTDAAVQEDKYLPIVIVDGVTDGVSDGAYGASVSWDAEELASLPVLDTDVSTASDGCIMMGLPGEYIADQQAVLDRINEIRREACEQGINNPETGRPLTMDDYVPLKWSHELEEIARIRAAETSMTADHKRTNGGSWQSVDSEYTYVGECAAWNFSSSATSGIDQWYSEKEDWLNGDEDGSGHYTTLIRPAMRYVGGGTFYSTCTEYPNTTLVEFYSTFAGSGLDESFVDTTGECIQKLEVSEGKLQGDPYIMGTLSGVKGDDRPLFLMSSAAYSGAFNAKTKDLLFVNDVNWSSSDSGIASVSSDGTVTAGKCGSATITALAGNGSSDTAEFTVDHVLQKVPAVEATCTESGLTEGEKCSNCGEVTTAQETVPATGHAYGDWKVTKAATCTNDGREERTCANCGGKETRTITSPGHKWKDDYTVDKEATCTEEGSKSKHCSVCNTINKSTISSIPATGHAYGSWKVTEPATCTENGSQERVCKNCGNKETETLSAGHKWNLDYTIDKEGTCIEDGSESIHCSVCGAIDESTVRPIWKTPHRYGNWKVTKAATCTVDGSREETCLVCGVKYTETIKATGHKWKTTYTTDKKPTASSNGSKSIHCSVCGSIKPGSVQSIPRLTGSWKKDSTGWWYRWSDGTYPAGKFENIGGKTYYFNKAGYMVTGWQYIGGKWYYFNSDGAMRTGWLYDGGVWYYLNGSGVMVTGLQKIGSATYYFNGSGAMQTGWQYIGGKWYYFNSDGAMRTGWLYDGGAWYYLNGSGVMVIGLQRIGGIGYYFNRSGAMQTGWQYIGGKWYYFDGSGAMAVNRWVGDYYLTGNGVMATNTWIGKYYVGSDGKWIPGYKR